MSLFAHHLPQPRALIFLSPSSVPRCAQHLTMFHAPLALWTRALHLPAHAHMKYVPLMPGEVFDYLVTHGRMKEKEARLKFRQVRRVCACSRADRVGGPVPAQPVHRPSRCVYQIHTNIPGMSRLVMLERSVSCSFFALLAMTHPSCAPPGMIKCNPHVCKQM